MLQIHSNPETMGAAAAAHGAAKIIAAIEKQGYANINCVDRPVLLKH